MQNSCHLQFSPLFPFPSIAKLTVCQMGILGDREILPP